MSRIITIDCLYITDRSRMRIVSAAGVPPWRGAAASTVRPARDATNARPPPPSTAREPRWRIQSRERQKTPNRTCPRSTLPSRPCPRLCCSASPASVWLRCPRVLARLTVRPDRWPSCSACSSATRRLRLPPQLALASLCGSAATCCRIRLYGLHQLPADRHRRHGER